jgi:hypothetical protein
MSRVFLLKKAVPEIFLKGTAFVISTAFTVPARGTYVMDYILRIHSSENDFYYFK